MALGLIGWRTYWVWQSGPWDLPEAVKAGDVPPAIEPEQSLRAQTAPGNTDIIITKNLFDPERGAGVTRQAEASSRAGQRIRNLVLVGTVILGKDRFAIVQDSNSSTGGQPNSAQPAAPIRMKLGDQLEGFKLSEIADRRVVFTSGPSRVEVLLDYFRKVEAAPPPRPAAPGQAVQPGQIGPRVIPNLPRRERLPRPNE